MTDFLSPNTPQESPHSKEAQALAAMAKNKNLLLTLPPQSTENSLADAQLAFDSKAGDKGLTYLAKRMYSQFGKYPQQDALDAALLLSSRFVDKIGTPKLRDGDTLRIDGSQAILTYWKDDGTPRGTWGLETVNLWDPALKEQYDGAKSGVIVSAGAETVKLQNEIQPDSNPMVRKIESIKGAKVYGHDRFINGVEGYPVRLNGEYYYVVCDTKHNAYKLNKLASAGDQHRLTSPKTLVDWTKDFERVKNNLA